MAKRKTKTNTSIENKDKEILALKERLTLEHALNNIREVGSKMKRSEELKDTIWAIFLKFKRLELPIDALFIQINKSRSKDINLWLATPERIFPKTIHLNYFKNPIIDNYWAARAKRKTLLVRSYRKRDKNQFYRRLFKYSDPKPIAQNRQKFILDADRINTVFGLGKFGGIMALNYGNREFTDWEQQIIKRFTKVFEQVYARFLDLQKAEAQAREIQIEAALERVRAASIAMDSSTELNKVIDVIFNQLTSLGVKADACQINVFSDDTKDLYFYTAVAGAQYPKIVHVPYIRNAIYDMYSRSHPEGLVFLTASFSNRSIKPFFKHLLTQSEFGSFISKERKKLLARIQKISVSVAYCKYGALVLTNFQDIPLAEEYNLILQRMSIIYEQSYRRFLDLQNIERLAKEAQTEAALQRVRSKAMAMQNSSEVKGVVSIIHQQLLDLNIPSARCYIYVINEKTVDLWLSVAFDEDIHQFQLLLDWEDIPVLVENHNRWLRGETHGSYDFKGTEVKKWIEGLYKVSKGLFPKPNQVPKYQQNIEVFSQYGGLGIVNHENIKLGKVLPTLKRFGKSFEQVYMRFLDLQKAEAQAREAQIEAALERVRSTALAMRHSSELIQTVNAILKQINSLGVNLHSVHIYEFIDQLNNYNIWASAPGQHYALTLKCPPFDHPIFNRWQKAFDQGDDFFSIQLDQPEKNTFFQHFFDNLEHDVPIERQQLILGAPALDLSMTIQKHSGIAFIRYVKVPLSNIEIDIMQRLALVFEQAYVRFLDLQKAEAQTREFQIEVSLERVRARSTAMRKSDEMVEVLDVLFKQLDDLGVESSFYHISVFDKLKDNIILRFTDTSPDRNQVELNIDTNAIPAWKNSYNNWKKKKADPVERIHYKPEMVSGLLEIMEDIIASMPKEYRIISKNYPNGIYTIQGRSKFGYLGINSSVPLNEEHANLITRFSLEFERVYQRYLDLQNSEAQSREAQIEASLERVRNKAIGMDNSSQVTDVVSAIQLEIQSLQVPLVSCYIYVVKEKTIDLWLTMMTFQGMLQTQLEVDWPSVAALVENHKRWSRGDQFAVYDFRDKQVIKWYDELHEYSKGAFQKPERVPPYQQNIEVFNRLGGIGILNFEEHNVKDIVPTLSRFGKSFEQVYTRFRDLKKAETQAREAQIESALENVRSSAMRMHNSGDLGLVATVLFEELNLLSLDLLRCGIGIINEETKCVDMWATTAVGENKKAEVVGNEFLEGHALLEEIYKNWLKQKSFQYQLHGDDLEEYYKVVATTNYQLPRSVTQKITKTTLQHYLCSMFPAGGLYMFRESVYTDDDIQLIQRFADTFNIAYTRYEDLKKAEAQAKQAIRDASLDRVRAEIASMRKATDLEKITPLIWKELHTLEVPFFRCGVFIVDENEQIINAFLSTPGGDSIAGLNIPFGASELVDKSIDHWRLKKVLTKKWDRQQFEDWNADLIEKGYLSDAENYQSIEEPPKNMFLHFVPFSQGMLYVGNVLMLNASQVELMKSLADAFSVAYARYDDFSKLEKTLGELKETQTQLIQSEKMASLGELTAGIAHEIQNPLNFVNNFSEVSTELIEEAKEELDQGDISEAKEILTDLIQNIDKINHHGKRASSIVKGMLDHSRTSSGDRVLTDINALCDEYLRLAYHGMRAKDKSFNAKFETDFDAHLPKVNIVAQDIGRVILNIINNAFFTVDKKMKSKDIEDYQPMVKIETCNLDDGIKIQITDNGQGMSDEVLEKVFQPFFTTKTTGQGTGLGMSISYDIVTKGHEGELIVESEVGAGTIFKITLPMKETNEE